MDRTPARIELEHEATWSSVITGIILYYFAQGYTSNEVLRKQAILGCLFKRMPGEDIVARCNEDSNAVESFAFH